jgi:GTP-binding protein
METPLGKVIELQAKLAIAEAAVILMLADATTGLIPDDIYLAQTLRQANKPVILVVNKVDSTARESLVPEFYELGLGDPIPISAHHHRGIDDLLERIIEHFPAFLPETSADSEIPALAIVGRPNVGKSLLANSILGEERSIVTEIPGTTRDSIDTLCEVAGQRMLLIDTAGIRKRGAIERGIEQFSVMRSIRAIDRCSVGILVLDALEIGTAQDLHIAGHLSTSFKGVVVAINKWDLAVELGWDWETMKAAVAGRLKFMDYVPICFTSALTGEGINELLKTARWTYNEWVRWIDHQDLNSTVMRAIADHLPPKQGSKTLKIYRCKQESTGPPSFIFYCNNPSLVHFSYERYLENVIRNIFNFKGTPLRLEFRGNGKSHVIGGNRESKRSRR